MEGLSIVDTHGLSDSVVYSQVLSGIKGAYNKYGVGDGNYPNVKGILTDRILNNIWLKNNLDARIFIDGKGITSVISMDARASSVRVPLMAPPPFAPRTISVDQCGNNGITGTPGNDGLENNCLPNTVQTDGVDVVFNQVYDRATVVYKVSQNMLSMDLLGKYNSMLPEAAANMRDTTILAAHIGNGLHRGALKGNSNIVTVDMSKADQEGYLQEVMNGLISTMTNPATSWDEGVVQYDLDSCVIVMKQAFWNKLFRINNGVLVNGGNMTPEMLMGGAFTKTGEPLGKNVRGIYSGVQIKVVPDSYWFQAAAYMGLTPEQFAEFDKVQAYIASSDGTAVGQLDASVNPIPNPGNAIGTKIQTLWQWGVNVVRGSSIGVIVTSDFVNPINVKPNLVAPANFNEIIKTYGNIHVNYGDCRKLGFVGGDIATSVTLTITGASSEKITNAGLKIVDGDGQVKGYTNNGDGTYNFVLTRGGTATVEVVATGYNTETISITKENTATATYAVSQALTAASRASK